MKKAILFFLLSPIIIVAQRSHLSYSNSYLIPVSQTPLSDFPQSGEIQIAPSSYFKGLNYEFDLIDSTWSLKAGVVRAAKIILLPIITSISIIIRCHRICRYLQIVPN
jgi:hypothetical protein